MFIKGVDVTKEAGVICGSLWIVVYIALVWFVWTRKPKTQVGRRWKAAWLLGGLPVLGMPLIVPIFISGILVIQSPISKFDFTALPEIIQKIFSSYLLTFGCIVPISIFMSVITILGTYNRFRTFGTYNRFGIFSDSVLDKIVPPLKDEKHDTENWY